MHLISCSCIDEPLPTVIHACVPPSLKETIFSRPCVYSYSLAIILIATYTDAHVENDLLAQPKNLEKLTLPSHRF